jgi:hypothetical protein
MYPCSSTGRYLASEVLPPALSCPLYRVRYAPNETTRSSRLHRPIPPCEIKGEIPRLSGIQQSSTLHLRVHDRLQGDLRRHLLRQFLVHRQAKPLHTQGYHTSIHYMPASSEPWRVSVHTQLGRGSGSRQDMAIPLVGSLPATFWPLPREIGSTPQLSLRLSHHHFPLGHPPLRTAYRHGRATAYYGVLGKG